MLATKNPINIYEYAEQFGSLLITSFQIAKAIGSLKDYPEPDETGVISRVIIFAYWGGRPSLCIVSFIEKDGTLSTPQVALETPPRDSKFAFVVGSANLFSFMEQQGHWVQNYVNPLWPDVSALDAAKLTEGYIRACIDPRIREIDPNSKIGGHVHVATLSPKDGFQWVIPPKNSN